MRIGELKKRIEIQTPTKVSDGMGGFVLSFSTMATIWGSLWPISASEQIQSMQPGMIVTHRIRIRYRSVLRPDWRLKYGNRYFNIVSILNPNTANKMLEILCKEAI